MTIAALVDARGGLVPCDTASSTVTAVNVSRMRLMMNV